MQEILEVLKETAIDSIKIITIFIYNISNNGIYRT